MTLLRQRVVGAENLSVQEYMASSETPSLSFRTDQALAMKVIAGFTPVQTGSGDASPTNVRPFTGLTQFTVSNGQNNSVTVDWSSAAGTLYGGKVILKDDGSADVSSDWKYFTFTNDTGGFTARSTFIVTYDDVEYGTAYSYTNVNNLGFGQLFNNASCFCDKAKIVTSTTGLSDFNLKVSANGNSSVIDYYIKTSELDDVSTKEATRDSIKKWLADNGVHFLARLNTNESPTTYQISGNTPLYSIAGINTPVVNTNGPLAAWYQKTGKDYMDYKIGTDLVTKYIGRQNDGKGNFTASKDFNGKGEYVSGGYGGSPVYLPVKPEYRYLKSKDGRLYSGKWYDEDLNLISGFAINNLSDTAIEAPPVNATYLRICTHNATNNWGIRIIRTE